MISNEGKLFSRASISTCLSSSRPARSCSRSFSRVRRACSRSSVGSSSPAGRRQRRQQQVEQALLGVLPGLLAHLDQPLLAHHVHGQLGEVAHHRLDVAADVADLGELRRLHLEERRVRQPRQPPRDLGLADAGRPDHEDVLRRHLLGQLRRQLLAPQAVAQRDRDGALGASLADDVLVQLRDDLTRGERARRGRGGFRQIDGHGQSAPGAPPPRARRGARRASSELFDHDRRVGVDADAGGNRHRLLGDRARLEGRVPRQGPRRRQRVRPARSDRDDPLVGLDEIPVAREQERVGARPPRAASPPAGAGCGRSASPSPAPRPTAPGSRGTAPASTRSARRGRTSRPPTRRTRPGSGRCRAAGSCAPTA